MRIAFVIPQFGKEWLGGLNYFRSLFKALAVQNPKIIHPVLFVPSDAIANAMESFPGVEIIGSKLIQRGTMAHALRKVVDRITKRDWFLEHLLIRHRIDLASHSPALGRKARIPCLIWIPDLQHLHLPEFFTAGEIQVRTKRISEQGNKCTAIIVSSHCTYRDVKNLSAEMGRKVRVLHFVPYIMDSMIVIPREKLEIKYQFAGKYFFLPNQYWTHKNHITVIAALSKLASEGVEIQVISTGATEDYRSPEHYTEIIKMIKSAGLEDRYKILGVLPYSDIINLMHHSMAVVNPSLFEGWSTTVEEAKLLGKKMILSDIPVHHEQAGSSAVYFEGRSVSACAAALKYAWTDRSLEDCSSGHKILPSALSAVHQFADEYSHIVHKIYEETKNGLLD